jgi:hypothetical protein
MQIINIFTTRTIFGTEYRSLSSSLCNFLHFPVTSSLLGPNTLLNTLLSNTLRLRSSVNVSDQVSHPYRTTGNIIVLYILIFNFLDGGSSTVHIYTQTVHRATQKFWKSAGRALWSTIFTGNGSKHYMHTYTHTHKHTRRRRSAFTNPVSKVEPLS